VVFRLSIDSPAQDTTLSELSRTRQARREHLIEVAQDLFLSDGYHGSTMERIAARADVSKATLYKYFPDKEQLFLALVRERRLGPDQELLKDYHATLELALTQLARPGSREQIADAIEQLFVNASERRNDVFYRLMLEISFDQPELMQQVRQELRGNSLETVLELSKEASANLPSEIEGEILLQLLFTTITGYSLLEGVVFGRERLEPRRLARALASLLCAALE
jgi:TetR/AcrR family transcriptional regulator of autoinduction and epiphytic fitness